jgi:hypothetical protein
MKFAIVRCGEHVVEYIDADMLEQVLTKAGLASGSIDFATIQHPTDAAYGIEIAVYEYGLYADPSAQEYFSIGRALFAGNAVLFGFDEAGNTVDIPLHPLFPQWYRDGHDVEAAIRAGKIDRPVFVVNGVIMWQWPDRKPDNVP